MDTNTKTIILWSGVAVLVVAGIVMLFASFGGSKDDSRRGLKCSLYKRCFNSCRSTTNLAGRDAICDA